VVLTKLLCTLIHSLYTHTHTQYMYNIALCTYMNVCTYMHPYWKPLHPLCLLSDYMPSASSVHCSDSQPTIYNSTGIHTVDLTGRHLQKYYQLEQRYLFVGLCIDSRITLQHIVKKWLCECRLDSSAPVVEYCEQRKLLGSTK
jgi:hypothetical protein